MWKRIRSWMQQSTVPIVVALVVFVLLCSVFITLLERPVNSEFQDIRDGIWWSIVTMTTTGYGDKIPVTPLGKFIASVLILVGLLATVLISGFIASLLVEKRHSARRGLLGLKHLRNHMIICGWRGADMENILLNILKSDSRLIPEKIVIISSVDYEKVQILSNHRDLRGIQFVGGDCYAETSLKRANLRQASKVLVLTDTWQTSDHVESDSKVVMTVLAIRAISKDVYIVAELNDPKYRYHLKHAACDEIVFLRDFSQKILATVSTTQGLSNILFDLIDTSKGTQITTQDIPQELIAQPYRKLKEWSTSHNKEHVLIGLLENSGSHSAIKQTAIREAQKTANITQLIDNLLEVRNLVMNHPVFIPDSDYIVKANSLAIFIQRAQQRLQES